MQSRKTKKLNNRRSLRSLVRAMKRVALVATAASIAACAAAPQKACNPMKEECTIGDDLKPRNEPQKTGPRLLERNKVGNFYI